MQMAPKALILGVSGQDGAYLAELLARKGYEVHGTSRNNTAASFENLRKMKLGKHVTVHSLGLDSVEEIRGILNKINPDEIYNLAGQSSVGRSFERPMETFQSIANATMNILEAMRLDKMRARFFNAGSGEMFGVTDVPATEESPINPKSPYGVAKAAAFHLVKSYRESCGIFAATGILFNHESPLRPETFVTRKTVKAAKHIANGSKERLKLGNLKIYRDWGWAPEYVDAMWRIIQHEEPEDFVIATGKAHSLEEFLSEAFSQLGLDANNHSESDPLLMRPSEISRSCGDPSKAKNKLGWSPNTNFNQMIGKLLDAEGKAD
jgi:GDPmannose 4,6-dehydratase